MKTLRVTFLMAMGLLLAACSGEERDTRLRTFYNPGNGPEEFAILPNKPLEEPKNFSELPAPTPGGTNRSDLTPKEDAVAALGGRPSALQPSGVPGSESALVNYASRKGRDDGIRQTLAQEDADFRKRRGRFTNIRIFRVDRYYEIYKRQSVKPQAAAERWRRAGAPTPTAPPQN